MPLDLEAKNYARQISLKAVFELSKSAHHKEPRSSRGLRHAFSLGLRMTTKKHKLTHMHHTMRAARTGRLPPLVQGLHPVRARFQRKWMRCWRALALKRLFIEQFGTCQPVFVVLARFLSSALVAIVALILSDTGETGTTRVQCILTEFQLVWRLAL